MNLVEFWILSVRYFARSWETESYAVGVYGFDEQTLL